MATNGFTLSELPRAPVIPANVGVFDSEAARRAAAQQIALYKQLANAGADRDAQQAKLALEAKQDTAAQSLVDPQTADKLSALDASTRTNKIRSNVLQQADQNLVKSGVLSAQADVGAQGATLAQQQNLSALRERSKSEVADVQRKFKEAANFADHDAEANALEQIEQEHPWIAQLPEYKDQHELLKGHIAAARQRALDLQKNAAAEDRAKIIAGSGVEKANIAGKTAMDVQRLKSEGQPKEFERESNNYIKYTELAAAAEDQDDKEMYEERARVAKTRMDALNATKAGAGAPGSAQFQKQQMGAQRALNGAEDRLNRLGPLIDRIIPRVTRTGGAGIGSLLASIPESDARALRADIDTLKANIGFAELNNLRQQSPTGGALGQVSERELHFLQNVITSLDTGLAPDVLKANLARAKVDIAGSVQRLRDAYERDFGGNKADAGGAAPAAPRSFASESEAEAAKLPSGTKVIINGVPGTWH